MIKKFKFQISNFKKCLIAIGVFAFLGFLDATYLTILHYQNIIPPCTVTQGCEKVLTSPYSQIGPIPVSLFGSIFFLTIIILSVRLLIGKTVKQYSVKQHTGLPVTDLLIHRFTDLPTLLFFLALIGFLVSLTFFLIQLLIIKEFCPYCLFSELMSFLVLTLSIILIRVKEGK